MSHLTQMAGLAVQNFTSAAVGLAVAIAFVRGLDPRSRDDARELLGRPDPRRSPGCSCRSRVVLALVLVSQGVVQNLNGFTDARDARGCHPDDSRWPDREPGGDQGARHERRRLRTNANSAHPFENPTGFTNLLQILALLCIPFALTYTYGRLVKDQRQGWVVFASMFAIWIAAAGPRDPLRAAGQSRASTRSAPSGPNMEGKETRFGIPATGLFAASTTGTSTGAVIGSHDSFTPLGGAVPLVHMMLGEVSPGGVGAGLYGMLVFALLAVFLAGLMVGRTPEYLGKKVQATEMKLVVLLPHRGPAARSSASRQPPSSSAAAKASILNPGTARSLRGRLRVHLGLEQQRLGVRRA